MNQKALAAACSVTQPSISELETGETKEVSGPLLIQICNTLQIRPSWLVWNKGPMEPTAADMALAPDEITLIQKYRAASPTWRGALQNLAGIDRKQQDWLMENVIATVFQPAVSNEKVELHIPLPPDPGPAPKR